MFPAGLYLLALIVGAVISAACMPLWKRWCEHVGLLDAPGPRKIHTYPIPLAGGLAVVTGLTVPIVGSVAWAWLGPLPESFSNILAHGLAKRGWQLAAILGGAIAMLTLGLIDDKRDLSPKWKFLGQILIALAVAASGIRVTIFVENTVFSYAITVLWILTITNAINFQDNMNGLCAGLGLISGWFFAWHAGLEGQYLVASLAFLFIGTLAGFLPFNFPNSRVFLGDGGSHVVGFLLALLAILPDFHSITSPNKWLVVSPLLVLAVPLSDLVSVILIRLRMSQPIWIGDTNHFSHRLVRAGFDNSRAVLVLLLSAAVTGAVTFLK